MTISNSNRAQAAPAPYQMPKERNALKATGPRTEQGKAASSKNAIKHGLTARQVVIPGENQADFDALLESIAADRKPSGELEVQWVGEIAACTWRLARARAKEAEILTRQFDLFANGGAPAWDRLMRYMASIERELSRASTRLQQLQAERRKQQTAEPGEETAKTQSTASVSTASAEPEFVSQSSKPLLPATPAAPARTRRAAS